MLSHGFTILILLSKSLAALKPRNYRIRRMKILYFYHCCHTATKFAVSIKEDQERLPTIYWLPQLYKRPYKACFILNSSSCTTTEPSKLLTSCLTAIKKHLIKYCEKAYERSGKNLFWSIKNSGETLNKIKFRGFRATVNL